MIWRVMDGLQVRMIQGDGISIDSLGTICNYMKDKGWAVDNSAFGSGGLFTFSAYSCMYFR